MAKAKKSAESNPKPSLAANRRKRRARANPARANPAPRERSYSANPPVTQDLVQVILPGFAAYAATRILARIVYSVVQKRWPKLGKHAHAIAGVAAFGGMWFFAHKIKSLARFHDGVLMGSGVAAAHGIAQCYLPQKYNWLLADCKPDDVKPLQALPAPGDQKPLSIAELSPSGIQDEFTAAEILAERQMNRAGGPLKASDTAKVSSQQVAASNSEAEPDDELAQILGDGEDVEDLYSGAFEN